ncbi:MAG: hypothetical protein Q4D19_11200, partial [Lautropia sp.]|nr:hypothetical protein [Lautropia sp.]
LLHREVDDRLENGRLSPALRLVVPLKLLPLIILKRKVHVDEVQILALPLGAAFQLQQQLNIGQMDEAD